MKGPMRREQTWQRSLARSAADLGAVAAQRSSYVARGRAQAASLSPVRPVSARPWHARSPALRTARDESPRFAEHAEDSRSGEIAQRGIKPVIG